MSYLYWYNVPTKYSANHLTCDAGVVSLHVGHEVFWAGLQLLEVRVGYSEVT